MLPPIPVLADYGISAEHGFLPLELPLEVLPDPYYSKWEAIIANLQSLLLSKRLRGLIQALPILSTSRLDQPAQWRRAYVLLSFMTHAYIWGGDEPEEVCLSRNASSIDTDWRCSGSLLHWQFHTSRYPNISNFHPWRRMPPSASGISNPYSRMSRSIAWGIYPRWPHSQARSTNHGFT